MFIYKTMEYKVVALATVTVVILETIGALQGEETDYTDPIKCFYCFGPLNNSTCADPVSPKMDKGKALMVIECESGICLKWTHSYQNTMYMHRTCSNKLDDFKIMMSNGVCRSERQGDGYLCMCGKNLCNSTTTLRCEPYSVSLTTFMIILLIYNNRGNRIF